MIRFRFVDRIAWAVTVSADEAQQDVVEFMERLKGIGVVEYRFSDNVFGS